ncbi:MAG TPA: hypothetical protein VMR16_03180, partial [Candidatus Saccharimonadales bacterium]|nr:hypothetical protein [Candidatus Saccharimonadales bacterium]
RLGYDAKDADDIPRLARWEDNTTHKPIKLDDVSFVDYSKVSWNWDKKNLLRTLKDNDTLFICGSASNQFDFYKLFSRVFILDVTPEIQSHRLKTRTSEYGKSQDMISRLIDKQAEFLKKSILLGATPLDNNSTIDKTIKELFKYVKNNQ